jgi:protein-S-isoprenylcysteine O-methyltransferase Ste14
MGTQFKRYVCGTPDMTLLVYFTVYFLLAFVWRSLLVYKRSGLNPLVLPSRDDAYGYVGRAFKLVILLVFGVVVLNAFAPDALALAGPITALQAKGVALTGWVLLAVSLLFLLAAQANMGNSWRIGIDEQHRTSLVQTGIFSFSRNPIFLAMRLNLVGFFLVLPNAATLAILASAELLMQVQVRLEEVHLQSLHGATYNEYRSAVRRWL